MRPDHWQEWFYPPGEGRTERAPCRVKGISLFVREETAEFS
jgi:hypothetical protein